MNMVFSKEDMRGMDFHDESELIFDIVSYQAYEIARGDI